MKQLFPRGKRIRPTDKDLVFHAALAALFPVFLLVVLLFHIRQIAGTNWQEVSLSQITQDVNIPYLLFSMGVAGMVCLVAVLLFRRYRRDEVKQLIHRQKLARMVLENKWYESEQRKEDAFFKDLSSSRSKETITYFPKIYYRMKQGLLHIRVEITLGKYQEQLLNLEKKLESGLYCELTDRELKDSYVEYTLLYDTIANRISIEDVQAKNGRLRLMKNVWWEYDKLPHMLIAGGTGGGKTYFILTLIEALLRTNAVLFVLDPKNADLADLQVVMPDVYYKKEDMLSCIDRFYEEMMKRSEDMKLMENYRTGENYAYLGLPSNFLIFDEYVAFMEMLGTKENAAVLNKLKQIVMLGRQAGFFLILACQRPDAKYLGDGIRDQFNFRVALGRMSEMGYGMMFGETTKDFFLKQIKGRGYETNHNVRFQFIKWKNDITLGEMIVNEGLAENFATFLYGEDKAGPWVTKTDIETLNEYIKPIIRDGLNVQGLENLNAYLYGDEMAALQNYPQVGLPYCSGYACGYHLIKHYLQKTGKNIVEATLLPAKEILNATEDFWNE